MTRFSTKDLIVATTLVAIGLGMACFAWPPNFDDAIPNEVTVGVFSLSGVFLGAGVSKPFGNAWLGGCIGFMLMAILCVLLAADVFGWLLAMRNFR